MNDPARPSAARARTGRTVLALALAVPVIVIAAFLLWAANPLGPDISALDALRSDTRVHVEETAEGWEFRPVKPAIEPTTAFVFYPGGRVDARSYARLCRRVAENGRLVILLRVPLSLAVFAPDQADRVLSGYPSIANWVVGGHSLGGAMAAQFAGKREAKVAGLVLLASYPPDSVSLRSERFPVASVYGSEEGIARSPGLARSRDRLPADTLWQVIDGANHAQFGDYGPQPGDAPATIPAADQQSAAAAAIEGVLARAAAGR